MDDLVAFLKARVTERQSLIMRAVKKTKSGERLDRGESKVVIEKRIRALTELELDVVNQMVQESETVRRILATHRTAVNDQVPGFPLYGRDYWCETCHVPSDEAGSNWCMTLRLLALPYADHKEYNDAWKP
ncbi:DUF6221 family protein [Amycolatopsis sp. NPDC059657]|uniref:DUF6221 family protein n=1 Tax=Amycolatopsis sp. NPDC059657 TaxID=3346899 RepID=UPI00366E5572